MIKGSTWWMWFCYTYSVAMNTSTVFPAKSVDVSLPENCVWVVYTYCHRTPLSTEKCRQQPIHKKLLIIIIII